MTADKNHRREQVKIAIESQKRPTVTVLSSLLAIQDSMGYISDEAIEEVAKAMKTSVNDVYGVASFYPNFRFSPPSEHTVEVCWGPTCHLLGANYLIERILKMLKLEGEGDTEDGKFTFRFNTCLGACSQGPVISIDHELYGKSTPDNAEKLVNRTRDTKTKHN